MKGNFQARFWNSGGRGDSPTDCSGMWGTGVRTGIAVRLYGEPLERLGLTLALGPWAWGLRGHWIHSGGGAGPRPLEHDAQPKTISTSW